MYSKVKDKVIKIFKYSKSSHDWDHTERVLRLCEHIAKEEKADLGIVKYAALLHDIGRKYEFLFFKRRCHAKIGAKKAYKILNKYNINKEKKDKIIHCIESHRYRGGIEPKTMEAKILFDADKLDAIGAVGIGRAFLFAGEVGAKLHNKGVDISKTESFTIEDTAYREYMVKLRFIKDRLLTRSGKKIAKERHGFMVDFFKRLDKEVEGEI